MGTTALTNSQAYRYRRRKSRNPKNLASIWGLGKRHSAALQSVGIPDCQTLMDSDPQTVHDMLREQQLPISLTQVKQWRSHAESYCTKRPVFFGEPPAIGDSFIALDLEYSSFNPHIWLTGLLVVKDGKRRHLWFWADDQEQERASMLRLTHVLKAFPDLPILTWAGTSADLPQLQSAAERHGALDMLAALNDRHIDLFQHARTSVRLPMPELSLGPFASYLRIPTSSPIRNGLEAQVQYEIYQGLVDPVRKSSRKAELIAYNYDDLRALVGVLKAMLEGLYSSPPQAPKGPAQTSTRTSNVTSQLDIDSVALRLY
jgi:predicted RecB family nuclease